jgi:hypothetical protein
MDIHEC